MIHPTPRTTLFPYTTLFRSRPPALHLRVLRTAARRRAWRASAGLTARSEEHTSELQSQSNLVCRLLLEKKNQNLSHSTTYTHHTKLANRILTYDTSLP